MRLLPWRGRRSRKDRPTRLTVRPTARGWQALVIGAAVFGVARLIGTTQFHQLAYALLLLPVASFVLGYATSRGLRFSRSLPPGSRFTAGKPARIDLLVSNDSRLDTSGVRVIDRLPDEQIFEAASLRGHGADAIEVPVTFARRGVYELGPAEVGAADPFGLLRFSRRFSETTEVVVYPEVHGLAGFPLRGGDVEAGSHGTRGQRGDEFAGLREYRRGDDQRHIHWKSVARTGELFVKEFAIEAPRRYTVALDLRRSGLRAQEREIEDSVSCAASVLTHLLKEHLPARLLCTNGAVETTEFGPDEASYGRAMRVLATVRADGDRDLGEVLLAQRGSLGEGVVAVWRAGDEGLPAAVRKLRAAGVSVIVVALAAHTYRGYPAASPGDRTGDRAGDRAGERANEREAEFLGSVARLDAAGATVRVIRHPEGVAGLSGEKARGAGPANAGSANAGSANAGSANRGAV